MSVLTFEISSPSIVSRIAEYVQQLLHTQSAQLRNYDELKTLPDHLLLDIGVDPRDVPSNIVGERAFRTSAKS